ncbi:hypothetical protein BKP45_20805 [Anaerobacillus alkalidiazotrophicus]|uniref:BclA C-terminal domain-containing protein n=1 Tax=Anaerobacillus alkalidiazotrophicus TaxID=472963 RepID=A0A1S2LYZ1_9BACI|nr:hypothetical protein [Anaerobacillus alkalidiazotrophicus]OIJ16937.1 hypothetical protein BKP45_20805 [Anaerobacillus alkalidiazotrophicus]
MAQLSSCCCNCPSISPQPVFGSLFGSNGAFTATNNTNLIFPTAGPTSGMVAAPAPTNSITIQSFGVYEISFSLTSSTNSTISGVEYYIYINGVQLSVSLISFVDQLDTVAPRNPGGKTILTTLNPNDDITVRSIVLTGTSTYINPTLVVKKIS